MPSSWLCEQPGKLYSSILKTPEKEEFFKCVLLFGAGVVLLMALDRGFSSYEAIKQV